VCGPSLRTSPADQSGFNSPFPCKQAPLVFGYLHRCPWQAGRRGVPVPLCITVHSKYNHRRRLWHMPPPPLAKGNNHISNSAGKPVHARQVQVRAGASMRGGAGRQQSRRHGSRAKITRYAHMWVPTRMHINSADGTGGALPGAGGVKVPQRCCPCAHLHSRPSHHPPCRGRDGRVPARPGRAPAAGMGRWAAGFVYKTVQITKHARPIKKRHMHGRRPEMYSIKKSPARPPCPFVHLRTTRHPGQVSSC
jgi:hypothetical protein